MIARINQGMGYRWATFDSTEGFLDSGCVSEIDYVLLDIRMPVMSGLDLHLALTQMNHPAPVLYVTATPDSGLRERALSQGAAAFLAKTFDDEHLLNTIHLVLNSSGRDRACLHHSSRFLSYRVFIRRSSSTP